MMKQKIAELLKDKPKFNSLDYTSGTEELNKTQLLLQLIIHHYENKNYDEKSDVIYAITHSLDEILYKGNEPTFDNSHNWGYPALCASITLIKNKEDLWNAFSDDAKDRMDVIMRMFALMWNFGCNAYNNFKSGIGLHGNYHKNWGPNYRLSNNMLFPYILNYFGDIEAVNNIFIESDSYNKTINLLSKFNFRNALAVWTRAEINYDELTAPSAEFLYTYKTQPNILRPAYDLYMKDNLGNTIKYGYGSGCQIPAAYISDSVIYRKEDITVPLIHDVLEDTFSGGKVVSEVYIEDADFTCSMPNNLKSPYEGQEGMMDEFDAPDILMRSSLWHCELDFILCMIHFKALSLLDVFDIKKCHYWNKVNVGMNDFIFKKENGYIGFSMGNTEENLKELKSSYWIDEWKKFSESEVI